MYQINVILTYPNTDSNPKAKPTIEETFSFEVDCYNIYESIPMSVINDEILKNGFDKSNLIDTAFYVKWLKQK